MGHLNKSNFDESSNNFKEASLQELTSSIQNRSSQVIANTQTVSLIGIR
jgi:hypothetical protein